MDKVFVLGAADPEMEYIESLLKEQGIRYAYATFQNERVKPSQAYKTNGFKLPSHLLDKPASMKGAIVVWVECYDRDNMMSHDIVIDHHRPGDFGYDKKPAQFWDASSVGQVFNLLGWHPTSDQPLIVAAADHCLSNAYAGECPGVSPDKLYEWRINTRSAFQKCTPYSLKAKIKKAITKIKEATPFDFAGIPVYDFRNEIIPELPEAAMLERIAYISKVPVSGGNMKVGIGGCTTPEAVRFFMDIWGPAQNLKDIYGAPERGYAGGYLS